MPRTMIRPDAQIAATDSQASSAAAGAPSNGTLADDLLSARSAIARALGTVNYYDPLVPDPAGQTRSNAQLNQSVYTIQNQPALTWVNNYTNIPITAGKNYVVLSVAQAQAPTPPIAVLPTSLGVVAAVSGQSGAAFAANELTQLAGADPLYPRNLVRIRNGADGSPVEDSSTTGDIMGLLQVESTAADQAVANDTSGGARLKISFVEINQTTKQLVAVPVASLPAGLTFNYVYRQRRTQSTLPEEAFGGGGQYVDNIGAADVTLSRAASNQGGQPVPVGSSILWQVANGQTFTVQNANGSQNILNIAPVSGGVGVQVAASTASFATTQPATFTQGLTVATAGTTVNVGVTAGQVDAAGLTVASTGTNPLKLNSGAQVAFRDAYIAGSAWSSSAVNLASGVSDYNAFKSTFGEVSLMSAAVAASMRSDRALVFADVTPAVVAAGTNVTGTGSNANVNATLPTYAIVPNPLRDVKVWLNGTLLRAGSSAAAGHDWFPGTSAANGDLMFNFALHGTAGLPGAKADVLAVEVFGGY